MEVIENKKLIFPDVVIIDFMEVVQNKTFN